ncbi:DUF2147 domain-containing protein [Aurantiacibacter sp. MUD11]|uniref:DUF2147 domain-containing protein n=1 Tax=Aurantiacibacter sp. MUD11 TaxID=3003265 RepID=UPI0022AA477C|nr:DUF2147 domain-containing protein [Aurantiacibacter sp. MUD11]WAT16702.1 DUF2147 domain-containing protein [Aurantiacibacter sp. MUD11]
MGLNRTAIIAAAAPLALLAPPAAAQRSIDGTYIDSGGYVEITVGPCGTSRCGTITRIIRHKSGESDRDVHNDDPALRDRPILGLRLLTGLTWDDGAWRGRVYNPEDGNTYRTEVRPAANGALEVKGCVAIICRTRLWPAAT